VLPHPVNDTLLAGMTVHFDRPGNSEVCVRRPAGWAGRRQLL